MLRLEIFPSYHDGFTFCWEPDPVENLSIASYKVQESPTGIDAFTDISGELVGLYCFTEEPRQTRKRNKRHDMYFRVQATLGSGAVVHSNVRTAHGDLPKREFLITRNIMRQEVLAMRTLSGVQIDIFRKMVEGTPCTVCVDPVSQRVMDPDCKVCGGTRFITGFHGPYRTYGKFSLTDIDTKHPQDNAGVDDDRVYQVRMIGQPTVHRKDVIVDVCNDRRYKVQDNKHAMEFRRQPVIQMLTVTEIPFGCVEYSLGATSGTA